jgi:hypothetical protein
MSTTPRVSGRVFGAGDGFFATFSDLYGQFWNNGVLDHTAKETARLRNARITDCGF